MKTFEGSSSSMAKAGVDWRIIYLMYLLRGVAVTLILLLLVYITNRILALYTLTFREFILDNLLFAISLCAFISAAQAIFYIYRSRKGVDLRRSVVEVIVGYALPIIAIASTVYAAYAIGAM